MKLTPEGAIAHRGLERLQESPYAPVRNLWCEYDQGVLILRGHVRSFFHKQLAQQIVVGLEGVQRIDNRVEVVGGKK